jgi:hypothetical protein
MEDLVLCLVKALFYIYLCQLYLLYNVNWIIVMNELQRIWKNVVMTYFKALYWHLP